MYLTQQGFYSMGQSRMEGGANNRMNTIALHTSRWDAYFIVSHWQCYLVISCHLINHWQVCSFAGSSVKEQFEWQAKLGNVCFTFHSLVLQWWALEHLCEHITVRFQLLTTMCQKPCYGVSGLILLIKATWSKPLLWTLYAWIVWVSCIIRPDSSSPPVPAA